jgi:hypothetical protein
MTKVTRNDETKAVFSCWFGFACFIDVGCANAIQ